MSTVLLARWLGPADRGLLALMLSLRDLALALGGVGIPMAVLYYASKGRETRDAILGNSLLVAGVLALVLVPAAALLAPELGDLFARGEGGSLWIVAAALVPITFLEYTLGNQLLGAQRFGTLNGLVVASKVVALVGVVVLVGLAGGGVAAGLASFVGASLLVSAGALVRLRPRRPRLDAPLLRGLAGYGVRVQAGALFQMMNYRLDILVLQAFRPLDAVGVYVIAQILAELVTSISLAAQSAVMALVGPADADAKQTAVRSMRHHGLLTAGAIVANAVFTPLVVVVAFGDAFRGAIEPFFVLLPGMWFLGAGIAAAGVLRGYGRPGASSAIAAATAGATLALDLLLIPPFGVTGAAVASLVAYVLFGVLSLRAAAGVLGEPVRALLPGRADLAVYPRVARTLLRRARGAATPAA